jgi:hypothetical protein
MMIVGAAPIIPDQAAIPGPGAAAFFIRFKRRADAESR